MSEPASLLQRFFDANLIPSDTTDTRLEHYQAAAKELSSRFVEAPADAVSATRVAIDSSCPESEPWFGIVQEAVKVHWKTFLINHYDEPRQICRAILLEALSIAVDETWDVTLGIWYAASPLLPHLGDRPELDIIRDFISGIGADCEKHSSSEWGISGENTDDLPVFDIDLPAIKVTKVSQVELTKGISAATGPTGADGVANDDPNANWPNTGQPWAHVFAPKAAASISSSVNKALASTAPAIKGVSEKLGPSLQQFAQKLCEWTIDSSKKSKRHTDLLWWKQALYSPASKKSYRDFSQVATVIGTPYDLSNISGYLIPISVDFFLCETIRTLHPDDPEISLKELIHLAREENNLDQFLPPVTSTEIRRISLREFISLSLKTEQPEEAFIPSIGIDQATSLKMSDWAIWILRDRQAEMVTTSSTD